MFTTLFELTQQTSGRIDETPDQLPRRGNRGRDGSSPAGRVDAGPPRIVRSLASTNARFAAPSVTLDHRETGQKRGAADGNRLRRGGLFAGDVGGGHAPFFNVESGLPVKRSKIKT